MQIILLIVVMGICCSQGYNAYTSEKQTKVFNKRELPLKDVKKYNHFCGKLIYGFGIAASLTMILMISGNVWMSVAGCVLLIIESIVLVKYYAKKEITFLNGH